MAASCVLAFRFPFELFLFSYAVLGPLHYLTEISWLHDRKYFTESGAAGKRKRAHQGWLALVAITMMALIVGFIAVEGAGIEAKPKWEITFFYLVFVSAALVTIVGNRALKIPLLVGSMVLLALFATSSYYITLAFFLVTIIHVLIFTGSFVLFGALKGRSVSGMLSLVVFVACAVSFFIWFPEGDVVSDGVRRVYRSFNALNAELLKMLHLGSGTTTTEIYESRGGLAIMRLIAFSYTYHYLNWFSKTSIIKWHEVPRSRTAVMIALWLAALALYAVNYDTGMAVLYFMSILHVMLEFPLNHRTFVGIGKELVAILNRPRATKSVPGPTSA
jgi:hypothetical protein